MLIFAEAVKPTWVTTHDSKPMNGTTQKTKTEKQVKLHCTVAGLPAPEIIWYKVHSG